MPHIEQLVGRDRIRVVKQNGDNLFVTNLPLP